MKKCQKVSPLGPLFGIFLPVSTDNCHVKSPDCHVESPNCHVERSRDILKSDTRTKSKLSATHAVKVSDVLAISVNQSPVVTDTDFENMEEMRTD